MCIYICTSINSLLQASYHSPANHGPAPSDETRLVSAGCTSSLSNIGHGRHGWWDFDQNQSNTFQSSHGKALRCLKMHENAMFSQRYCQAVEVFLSFSCLIVRGQGHRAVPGSHLKVTCQSCHTCWVYPPRQDTEVQFRSRLPDYSSLFLKDRKCLNFLKKAISLQAPLATQNSPSQPSACFSKDHFPVPMSLCAGNRFLLARCRFTMLSSKKAWLSLMKTTNGLVKL